MYVVIGAVAVVAGAAFAAFAAPLERMNAAASRFFFGENRGRTASAAHVWVFRVAGSGFCVMGLLIATGVVELSSHR